MRPTFADVRQPTDRYVLCLEIQTIAIFEITSRYQDKVNERPNPEKSAKRQR